MQIEPDEAEQLTAISPVSLSTAIRAASAIPEATFADGRDRTNDASRADMLIVSAAFACIPATITSESPGRTR